MLEPAKTKFRKLHKGRLKGLATRGSTVSFGDFGIKAVDRGFISSRQIEASRKAINRYIKRGGKVWIRIFPYKPVTEKAAETPMGSGKGSISHYVAPVKPGRVLMELTGVTEEVAREAFRLAGSKLPMKIKFVTAK